MAAFVFLYLTSVIVIFLIASFHYIRPKHGKLLLIGSIFIVSILLALIKPKEIYDLARHYAELDVIKNSGMKFWDFVLHSQKITDANYRYMYTFNVLRYIIAMYFPKQTLPFCSCSICFGVFGYILYDVIKQKKISNFYIGISIMASAIFMPMLYIYSGIRNEIAMAIMALAVYLKIYKGLGIFPYFVLIFWAATMHPLALVAIPFVLLSKIRIGKMGIILVILIPNILYVVMEVCRFSENGFLSYIGAKFYNYTFVNIYSQGRFFRYSAILMTALLLLLSVIKTKQEKEDQRFINFINWYSIFALANIQSYQISMRIPYLFGILAPVIVSTLFQDVKYCGFKKIFFVLASEITLIMGIYSFYSNYMWLLGGGKKK